MTKLPPEIGELTNLTRLNASGRRLTTRVTFPGLVDINAPTESFFGTLKTELVHHCQYQTKAEAKTDIFEYIEVFYNRFRRHLALCYQSPVNFEKLSLID